MDFRKLVRDISGTTCLSRNDWTSTLVRVVWIQLMKCSMHAHLGQHPEDGHLLYCSTSLALWHWKHKHSSNKYKGFYYQTGRKAVLTRDNCKACRDPMYCI